MFSLFKKIYGASVWSDSSNTKSVIEAQLIEKLAKLNEDDDKDENDNAEDAPDIVPIEKIDKNTCIKKNGKIFFISGLF